MSKDKTVITNISNLIDQINSQTTGDNNFIDSLNIVYNNKGDIEDIIPEITCGGVNLGDAQTFNNQNNEYNEVLLKIVKYFKEIKEANEVGGTPEGVPVTITETTPTTPGEQTTYTETPVAEETPTDPTEPTDNPVATYTLRKGTMDVYDENGNKIGTIGAGTYDVYEVKYDENGNIIAIRISKDGEPEQWIYFKNNTDDSYVVLPGQVGTYTTHERIDIYDKDGNKIGVLGPGTYTVYEVKYDDEGNIIAVRISKDGEPEQWIYLKTPNIDGYYAKNGQVGTYELKDGTTNIYDANGNIIGTIGPGTYTVYEVKYDDDGNIIAVRISKDGEPEQWIYLNFDPSNGKFIDLGQVGTYTCLEETIEICDEDGKIIGNLPGGTYRVYEVKYDDEGNVIAVRISPDGEPEQWIYVNNPNINGYYVEIGQIATYTLRSGTLNIYDANGNLIGTITPGTYNVYEIKYDAGGNVIAIRISKDGEPERWVYINIKNDDGVYNPVDQQTDVSTDEDGKGVLNLYNKKNSNLLGILGILAIIVGAGFILKKKLKKKKENEDEEYYDEEILGTDVEPGEYKIYEVEKDDDNNVKEVRISDDNQDEELWLEL